MTASIFHMINDIYHTVQKRNMEIRIEHSHARSDTFSRIDMLHIEILVNLQKRDVQFQQFSEKDLATCPPEFVTSPSSPRSSSPQRLRRLFDFRVNDVPCIVEDPDRSQFFHHHFISFRASTSDARWQVHLLFQFLVRKRRRQSISLFSSAC